LAVPAGGDSPDVFGMPSDSSWLCPPAPCNRPSDDKIDRPGSGDASTRQTTSFTRAKFLWLEQVCADPELTPLAFKLAYVLANLVNEREGFAWPSIGHLAVKCRVTENGVKKAIQRLTECGHLSIELGAGRCRTKSSASAAPLPFAGQIAPKR